MSELDLTLGGEPFRMTPQNTSLFTFMGELAMYNHIFFTTKHHGDGRINGTYLFRDNPSFGQLRAFMEENHYPMHLNMLEVPECDLNAWRGYYLKDLGESFPEEWTNGNDGNDF